MCGDGDGIEACLLEQLLPSLGIVDPPAVARAEAAVGHELLDQLPQRRFDLWKEHIISPLDTGRMTDACSGGGSIGGI